MGPGMEGGRWGEGTLVFGGYNAFGRCYSIKNNIKNKKEVGFGGEGRREQAGFK